MNALLGRLCTIRLVMGPVFRHPAKRQAGFVSWAALAAMLTLVLILIVRDINVTKEGLGPAAIFLSAGVGLLLGLLIFVYGLHNLHERRILLAWIYCPVGTICACLGLLGPIWYALLV